MWKRSFVGAIGALRHTTAVRGAATISSAVDSMILRSLKDHYMEVAKMNMPPVFSFSLSLSLLGFRVLPLCFTLTSHFYGRK